MVTGIHTNENSFSCRRCGTCCSKGGPGLHDADLRLVMEKIIEPASLYTIRPGELVRDNVKGGLVYTDSDIIKIRSVPGSSACVFFREKDNACGIYDLRPAECRAMKCVDPSEIIDMHVRSRMHRKDLFGSVAWLWEMIETHEAKCGYEYVNALIERRNKGDAAAADRLSGVVAYDRTIRDVAMEKGALSGGMPDLVFGLPLDIVLENRFGIKAHSLRAS